MAKKETSTYPLRLPRSLKEAAQHIAREDGTSFFATRKADADIEAARRLLRRQCGQPPEPEDRLP